MKCALVTGAAKGIGRATALSLAQDGFRIALHYNTSQKAAEEVAQEILKTGGEAQLFCADLAQPGEAERLIAEVQKNYGPLHTLVSNAGILEGQLLALTSPESWRRVIETNLNAPFLLTKAVSRILARQRAGRIIYLSSDAGLMGDLMRGAYSASKAGILGLCKTAARELAPSHVTVNAVAPGFIKTAMTAGTPEKRREKQQEQIPMGRYGTPEEVAAVIRFLASDDAEWITGQTIVVDGGLNMK